MRAKQFFAMVCLAAAGGAWAQSAAVRVEAFSPQGTLKDARQVTARFSAPVVAFGDPRVAAPFDVKCDAPGRGRWADTRHWIYDFEGDLPGGVECVFTVRVGLKAADGRAVAPAAFRFDTGGPSIRASWPAEGDESIDEEQAFVLALDAVADAKSIAAHAACVAEGVGERIGVRVIEGDERNRIIAEKRRRAWDLFTALDKRARTALIAVRNDRFDDLPIAVVKCARRLPPGAELKLVWGRGVRAASGLATAQDQTLAFRVRRDFIARVGCQRVNADAGCIPVLPLALELTAPIDRETALGVVMKTADGRTVRPVIPPDARTVEAIEFRGPFAARTEVAIELPNTFRDDAGRALANAGEFPLRVRIDDDPPLVKFPAAFGILERHAQPALPVTVRNVEAPLRGVQVDAGVAPARGTQLRVDGDDAALAHWLRRLHDGPSAPARKPGEEAREVRPGELPLLTEADARGAGARPLELPRPAGDRTFEVIGIALAQPGLHVVEIASPRLGAALHGEAKPYYVYAAALVTDLAIHFKHGRESSSAWVTRLDTGAPAAGAKVAVNDCAGKRLWEGEADASGIARIAMELPRYHRWQDCPHAPGGYLVTARLGDDRSFMLTTWNEGLQPWSFNLPGGYGESAATAHTVTDRALFRAGETVSMKHFVRVPTGQGFRTPAESRVSHAELTHVGSGQRYRVPLAWANGAATSAWQIPKDAKLGVYEIALAAAGGGEGRRLRSGSVRVEQFRVPLMRAVLKPPAAPAVNAEKVDIDVQLSYLAGGPAAGAAVKFRSRLAPHAFAFPAYDDFSFGGREPKEGIETLGFEQMFAGPDDEPAEARGEAGAFPARTESKHLDAQGGGRFTFDRLPKVAAPHALEVEMEYADPNGQLLTAATRALVLPSALQLGLRMEGWFATRERLSFRVLAVDADGRPQAGRTVAVEAYERRLNAYRKRLLGGFYAYEQTAEVKKLGAVCRGETDARGLVLCDGRAPGAGQLILVARAADAAGNVAVASRDVWIAAGDDWFGAGSSDRMDLVPDKRSYEPGETARIEVRMPFREATALVTVEREGVLETRVQRIGAASPYVEVPILDSFGPNAYVSVLAVRGRVDPEQPGPFAWLKRLVYRVGMWAGLVKEMPREVDTRPTALVDLARPAFRLGIAPIRVGWRGYELQVAVETGAPVYRVRETVPVSVRVTLPDGKPAAHAEIALAAVDEGLLALAPNRSWALLEAMMARRPIEVQTSTAQSQVIGKRHFGRKAAAPGGGGGAGSARELFDTLLAWHPRVKLDAEGRATIAVPLNDSLTSFRIEAIAHLGDARFGSGGTAVRTTQDVMLFAGLPPFVREGDRYAGMATVRNGSDRPLALDVTARYAAPGGEPNALPVQRVSLAPGEARTVAFAAQAPFDAPRLDWSIAAREADAGGKGARDALEVSQVVGAAHPVRVYQQTLQQLDPGKPLVMPAELPRGAVAGRGGIDVRVARSLGGDVSAIRAWAGRYAYTCLEQRVSVAVVLDDADGWEAVMARLPAYLDRDGLARFFATDRLEGDDGLTAYVLAIADAAGRPIPEASRERMLAGLAAFAEGRITRHGALPTADLALRKLAAIEALARHGRAKPAMLGAIEIAPQLWPTSGLIDWIGILQRVEGVPKRAERLAEARRLLRARLTFSGTTLAFSTEQADYLWWLMVSPDRNAVRTLLLAAEDAELREDAPRLARGALGRQQGGRWNTTVANAWGVLALRRFALAFEREPVTGWTGGRLGGEERRSDWSKSRSRATGDPVRGTPIGDGFDLAFAWPATPTELSVVHEGAGRPWAFVQSRAALPLAEPRFAGYAIRRTVAPVEQKTAGAWTRGDVYRVTLEIDAQADMTWVVVDDPIPAGAAILGTGLGGDPALAARGERRDGAAWPAFEERAFDGFRAYYRHVPKGRLKVEYTVRLDNPGTFELPASRVEAMYAPETVGELPVARMEVRP